MAWARYDDELPINWKVGTLLASGVDGAAAIGLHLLANTWSRNQGTAGFIPEFKPGQLLGDGKLGARLAGMLEDVGMFDAAEGGWQIHDFDEYSDPNDDGTPAAEKKRRISEARAAAGRKGGLAKAKQTPSKRSGKTEAQLQQTSSPDPDPVPDPFATGCTETTDDLQSVGPSSVVVEVARAMAERLWKHAVNVHPSKHKPWVESTAANIARERAAEIDKEALRWAHLDAEALAAGIVDGDWPQRLRAVPDIGDRPMLGPLHPPPKPPMSQDDYVAGVRARAEAGDEEAIAEMATWEKRAARKALQALGGSR